MKGVDVIIRNDFKSGMDPESYYASTIAKLRINMPDKEPFYIEGTNLMALNEPGTCDDWAFMILCEGFWLVDSGQMLDFLLTEERHLVREVAIKIAKALDVNESWYIDSAYLDFGWEIDMYDRYFAVTFEQLMHSIKPSQIIEYSLEYASDRAKLGDAYHEVFNDVYSTESN